jgi:hypothetical protein
MEACDGAENPLLTLLICKVDNGAAARHNGGHVSAVPARAALLL